MKKKNLYIITGSRSEFGLLHPLIKNIKQNKNFKLNLIAHGSHFNKNFGNTFEEIEDSNIKITNKIIIKTDNYSQKGIVNFFSLSVNAFSKLFDKKKIDLIILLGDRFETYAAAISAYFYNIPIAHIHGGEITHGSLDDGIRHSITKLSNFHFVSNKTYKKRIIQLGENPKSIFSVGALGIENINTIKFMSKLNIQKKLNINISSTTLLVTFHPITTRNAENKKYIENLLFALDKIKNVKIIFTKSNTDSDNSIINNKIYKYVRNNSQKSYFFKSLGTINYLSLLKHIDCLVGNSSSGIFEAPYLKIPTVNIGERQQGRVMSNSVINCNYESRNIIKSINYAINNKKKLDYKKLYGSGKVSSKIVEILEKINLKSIGHKVFYDL